MVGYAHYIYCIFEEIKAPCGFSVSSARVVSRLLYFFSALSVYSPVSVLILMISS